MGEGISPLDVALKYLTHLIWVPNRHLKLNIVKTESLIFFDAKSISPYFSKGHHHLSSCLDQNWVAIFLHFLTSISSLSLVSSTSQMFHEPTNFTTSTTTALIPTTIYRGMGEQEFRIWRVRFARSVRHSNDDKVDIDIMTLEYKKEDWARDRRLKAVWVPLVIKAIKTIWDHLESV